MQKVYVFGSRAKGTNRVDSDLDVAIEFADPVSQFDEDTRLAYWIQKSSAWREQLSSLTGHVVDLQFADPISPNILKYLDEYSVVAYEKVGGDAASTLANAKGA